MVATADVLILTNEHDISADWVVRELRRRDVPFLRLNTERLARAGVSITPSSGSWEIQRHDGRQVSFNEVSGIWYRRPEAPTGRSLDDLTDGERRLVQSQWRAVMDGLCTLPGAVMVNSPWANQRAESKVHQLQVAQRVGLRVPTTLVTNVRADALSFYDAHDGDVVVKGLDAPLIEDEVPKFVYAQRADRASIDGCEDVELAPMIFQEAVRNKTDVRVTVVGHRVFAAAARVDGEDVDWRAYKDRPNFAAHELDADVADRCRALVEQLGLVFGAIDLALTPDGYYFFEINPNGEWGWLQKTVRLPIAEALVDVLTRGDAG